MGRTIVIDDSPTAVTSDDGGVVIHRQARDRRRTRRRATAVFSTVSILFATAFVVLFSVGYHASRNVKGGFTTHRITDPTAPGYESAVLPTPVHLAAITDGEGKLVDCYLFIGGTSLKGGSVVWVVGDIGVVVDGKPLQSLDSLYDSGGLNAATTQLEQLLGLGVTDSITLGPTDLEQLLAPAGTLTITNPDPLFDVKNGQRKEVYPAGKLHLSAAEAAEFLRFRADGEVATNRATRASLVFDAYFAALAPNAGSSTNGATGKGVDDLVAVTAAMASGKTDFEILPVSDKPFGAARYFTSDAARIAELMQKVVPYPTSAFPGQRPRVRILAATTDPTAAAKAAPDVVAAGGEILVIGNAKAAVGAATLVEFHDSSQEAAAAKIAAKFGVTAVASSEQTETFDVTVTLGTDYHG